MEDGIRIGRFDQVRILTTKRVSYLSAPEGELLDPNGLWMVAGIVGNELLITKSNIVVRIPPTDVQKVLDYYKTFEDIKTALGRFNNYEARKRQEGTAEIPPRIDEED